MDLQHLSKELQPTLSLFKRQSLFRSFYQSNYQYSRVKDLCRSSLIQEVSGSRSTAWRLLLGVLSVKWDVAVWQQQLDQSRFNYYSLHSYYFTDQFQDEMQQSILNDMSRTGQELPLFRDPMVQTSLQQLLYIWARQNQNYQYQQGMNDIVATIFTCLVAELQFEESSNQLFDSLHEPRYIYADTYCLFAKVMSLGVEELFYQGGSPQWQDLDPLLTERQRKRKLIELKEQESKRTSLGSRCQTIVGLVKQVDPELFQKLQDINFPAEMCMLRWLRVLFAREFESEIYLVWDYFFADSFQLSNLNYFCAAVLQSMRPELLAADQQDVLILFLQNDKQFASVDRLLSISERVKQVLQRQFKINSYPMHFQSEEDPIEEQPTLDPELEEIKQFLSGLKTQNKNQIKIQYCTIF